MPIQFNHLFCAWMPIWAVRWARRYCRHGAVEFVTEFLLEQAEKLLDAQGIEHIFQPRLSAVGAVAVFNEQAHHRIRNLVSVVPPSTRRCHKRIAVAGDAPGRA